MQKFLGKVKQFAADGAGSIAITFAVSAIPVLIGAGAAIDYGRYVAVTTNMAASLDAASLAGATAGGTTDAQKVKIATDVFNQNISSGAAGGISMNASFIMVKGTMVGDVSTNLPMAFMNIVGIATMPAVVHNEVGPGASKKAEVALVLDYSGSMADPAGGQIKYVAMGQAATKLIDDLTAKDPSKVKVGLVPFSQHVYGTLPGSMVLGGGNGSWTGCTQDQQYPYNLSDAAPVANVAASKWGQPMVVHPWHSSCADYAAHSLFMRPLTNDFTSLKTQITAMTPYQNTHIALGAEFGYQMLSPNGAFADAVPYTDKSTVKFMVLLTDGTQTEPAFGPGGARNVSQGDSNLQSICGNAKTSGVIIVTIAYDLADNAQQQRLKACATNPNSGFFVVNSANDVSQAFQSITAAIQNTVYLSK